MDDEATMGTIGDEAKSTGGGVGVANDVGDSFAESKRKSGLFVGGQKIGDGGGVKFRENSDAGGLEGLTCGFDLPSEAAGSVANSFANFGEERYGRCLRRRRSRKQRAPELVHSVNNQRRRLRIVGGLGTFDEATGELGLEDDDG
jgi:hypothetical protein